MKTLVAFVLLLLGTALPASQSADSVALTEEATIVTLANRDVILVFERRGGKLKSFAWRGQELLASGGAYIQVALSGKKGQRPPIAWEYRLCRQEPTLVEIRFDNVDPQCPFDLAAHYVLRANEPGFHNYLSWGHNAQRSPGVHELAQLNFCLRADPRLFTTAAVDNQRIRPFPATDVLKRAPMVMDATYRLPDGSYYSKYFYSAALDERHTVHGMMGKDLGLWLMMPSHEHLNGGPQHQELTVHQTDSSPVLLGMASAAHYGAGPIVSDARAGSWSKVSAPWFIYANRAASQAELWQDAKRRAAEIVAAWPYPWLDAGRFQRERGTVRGRLQFDNGQPAGGARIILAAHEAEASPLDCQRQWQGYRFYTWADADGHFSLAGVRPGVYDLYAWRPGLVGTYSHRGPKVEPLRAADLGTLIWDQPRDRRLLWQIGVPDRSAGEFGFAENFRQWGLWDQIADALPGGVDFTVGRSKDCELPFLLAVTQKADFSWRLPVWRISFDDRGQRTGRAILTVAVAAAEGIRDPKIGLTLNGSDLEGIDRLPDSGAIHRSGLWGTCDVREVVFDASRLKAGTNVLTLSLAAPGRPVNKALGFPGSAIMPDCLRLEWVDAGR